MTLRKLSFDDDRIQYNDHTAEYEIILRRLFPQFRWRVARYEALVQQSKIPPNSRPPAWVIIEATGKNGRAAQSTEIDLEFFERVRSPDSLLSVIGERLKREIEGKRKR